MTLLGIDFNKRQAKNILFALISLELFFVLIYAINFTFHPSWALGVFFDLDSEANIPAWFSSVQFFTIGILFLIISNQKTETYPPNANFFKICGFLFIFLSADEGGKIHERVNLILNRFEWLEWFPSEHTLWTVPYLAIGLLYIIFNYRNLQAMFIKYRHETTLMVAGFATIIMGAVGLETLSQQCRLIDTSTMFNFIEVTCEEMLEMAGATIILYAGMLLGMKRAQPD